MRASVLAVGSLPELGGNKTGSIHILAVSTPSKKKSQNITMLDVLERIDADDDSVSATVSKREFRIFKELEASSYIEGQIGPDSHDAPDTMVDGVGFTTEGRLLMERLRKEKKEAGFLATTWRWLGPLAGWTGGIAATIVGAYILKKIGL